MPNMDKTGPDGEGQLTGRGLGSCGGFLRRFKNSLGRGRRGLGRGLGRRVRHSVRNDRGV